MNCNSLFSQIQVILHNDLQLSSSRFLVEDDPLAVCKSVELTYKGAIATYKFDKLPNDMKKLFPFFQETQRGVNAMCDYIIFYPNEKKLNIFIANLKSKNISNSHDQVHAGLIFAQFIVSTACRCMGKYEIPSFVEFKAIHLTSGASVTKNTTNPRNMKFDQYENGLKYVVRPCKVSCPLDVLSAMN